MSRTARQGRRLRVALLAVLLTAGLCGLVTPMRARAGVVRGASFPCGVPLRALRITSQRKDK